MFVVSSHCCSMSIQSIVLLILAISWSASGLSCSNKDCFDSWTATSSSKSNNYTAEWCANGIEVDFEVRASVKVDEWLGIGFSDNRILRNSDLVIGGMRNGKPFVEDRWTDQDSWRSSEVDKSQDVYNTNVEYSDGVMTMRFTRKRMTGDKSLDVELDFDGQFFMYALGGKVRNNLNIAREQYKAKSSERISLCPVVYATGIFRTSSSSTFGITSSAISISSFVESSSYSFVTYTPKSTVSIMPTTSIMTTTSIMPTTSSIHNHMIPSPTSATFVGPRCKLYEDLCERNSTCKMLFDDVEENCQNVFEWDESTRESEPVCTDKCKMSLMNFQRFGDDKLHCCDCGNITDDHKLEDVRYTIKCNRKRKNTLRWCVNATMPLAMCEDHRQKEMDGSNSCINIMNMCTKDRACKKVMNDMEKECEQVLMWKEFTRRPVCSERCLSAIAKFHNQKIGHLWRDCDCRMPRRGPLTSLTENKRSCMRSRNNLRSFCLYGHTCRDGQTFRCDWLASVCSKDPFCKSLQDDWHQKCGSVSNWTAEEKGGRPICSEDCKNANEKLMEHKIWRRETSCDCGDFDDSKSLGEIRSSEQCLRSRINMALYCRPMLTNSCPKDPCEPSTCSNAKDVCMRFDTCRQLYEDWEKKCTDLGEFYNTCSDECKNATYQLYRHPHGQDLKWCDCGLLENNSFDGPKTQEEVVSINQCYIRKSRMRDWCGVDDAGHCQSCTARKLCTQSCERVISQCENDTKCNTTWNYYRTKCRSAISWNTSSFTLPMCTNECRGWIGMLNMDPIGKYFQCCKCDDRNKECNHEMNNIGLFCYNGFKASTVCQNDRRLCGDSDMVMRGGPDNDRPREQDEFNKSQGPQENRDQEPREQFTSLDDRRMETQTCIQWIGRCRENKCCGKAFHEASYYCENVRNWENNSFAIPPVCSEKCSNALSILFNDPIGKNIRCCECGKFSDVDQSDFATLERLEICKRFRQNIQQFCGLLQINNCSQVRRDDKGICSVDNCQEVVRGCQANSSCKGRFDNWMEKCDTVLNSNHNHSQLMCSDECKQATNRLFNGPHGYKLKCCNCGTLNRQQMMQMNRMSTSGRPPMSRMPPIRSNMPSVNGRIPSMNPPPMPTPSMDPLSPLSCYIGRANMARHCNVSDSDCLDCKERVCPKSCEKMLYRCTNNTVCSKVWESYYTECKEVLSWDGNSIQPTCSNSCKRWIDRLQTNLIGKTLKCCECDEEDKDDRMKCVLEKQNTEKLCNVTWDSSDDCRANKKECEDKETNERNVRRDDQCPPKMCDEWHQRCSRDKTCTRFHNDVRFYCHNVLEWVDDRVEPMCRAECQMAIERLASVTNRTMGSNIMCCTCGNYSDLRSNSLESIRSWEQCKRERRNMKQFCKNNCADCNRRERPTSQSCKASMRMCDDISECRTMRNRISSTCSNVMMWERSDGRHPPCSNECREALMAMEGSSYSRMQCCECQHNDMTARERMLCEQKNRNVREFCSFQTKNDRCSTNQQRNMSENDDCFYHMERCNNDVQCRDLFYGYTDKCAMAFSGKRMPPDQETMCKEAAMNLFGYKDFGRNFMKCECDTFPELCRDLFKNRYLLDRSCKEATSRCRNDTACNALWSSFNSCTVTNGSCPWSCRAKAVLLYRHRFGKVWWRMCRPHFFEQVCFTLY